MKLKRIAGCVLTAALVLSGCGEREISSYVKLGSIENLDPEYAPIEVGDEDIDSAINDDLSNNADYAETDEPAEWGDYVQIYITAKTGDEILYDYTGEDFYDMLIGDGDWGNEFDDYLVGKKKGDAGSVTVTYEDSFEDMQLAGYTVDLDYEIIEVDHVTEPALDDAFIKEMGCSSLEEYREVKREELQEEAEISNNDAYQAALLEALVNRSEFEAYPASLKEEATAAIEDEYQGFADMFGMELEDAYNTFGITSEVLEEEIDYYAKQRIVFAAVIKEYGISISDEEYEKMLSQFAADEDYDSVEEVLDEYEESELREYFETLKVYELLEEKNPREK